MVPPLGSTDPSGSLINFQTYFTILSEPISRKVHFKSHASWIGMENNIANLAWSGMYNVECPVEALNDVLISTCSRRNLTKSIRSCCRDRAWFNNSCRFTQRDKQLIYSIWQTFCTRESWVNYVNLISIAKNIYSDDQGAISNEVLRNLFK